jgi:hypothetical protein
MWRVAFMRRKALVERGNGGSNDVHVRAVEELLHE